MLNDYYFCRLTFLCMNHPLEFFWKLLDLWIHLQKSLIGLAIWLYGEMHDYLDSTRHLKVYKHKKVRLHFHLIYPVKEKRYIFFLKFFFPNLCSIWSIILKFGIILYFWTKFVKNIIVSIWIDYQTTIKIW